MLDSLPDDKASNPVVNDDDKFITFQMAPSKDPADIGCGIFIFAIEKAKATK